MSKSILDRFGTATLDRRGFILKSARFGTAAGVGGFLLPACDPNASNEPADGSFERPWTKADPGEKPEVHVPQLYAALVDGGKVRLWVEVLDPGTGTTHAQQQDHYIEQIYIKDKFGNELGGQAFRYDNQARYIYTTEIPEGIDTLYVYEKCNLHGWWRAAYDVASLKVAPQGDFRRPLTAAQPGQWADKIAGHLPVFGQRPDGSYSIEVGDRAAGKLHEMTAQHYINAILVYDEYAQLRAYGQLDYNYNAEPIYDFSQVGGTSYLRIIASCNLHSWWEAVYAVNGGGA